MELLIRILRENGARRLVLRRCAGCGQPRRLVQRDGILRICTSCDHLRRGTAEPCAIYGNTKQVTTRERHGRPRLGRYSHPDRPHPDRTIAAPVSRLYNGLDPATPT